MKDVCIPGLNYHRFRRFYFSVYFLVFASIEKIYQTLKTVFHRLFKHLEFRKQYSAERRIFNSLLGVWISRQNNLVFDILLIFLYIFNLERFHSRVQQPCKFIETKESVYIRKELNSHRIGLVQQHGKKKCLHKKRVQLSQDWFGTTT